MDNLTLKQRQKNMQNIRSTGTLPEQRIMSELRAKNIYFAKHVASLPGKPDIVFRRRKVAIFIDSDFWHGHPRRFIMPQTRIEYWKPKIERNKLRDKQVSRVLRKSGWKVVRIWEYDVKRSLDKAVKKILSSIEEI